MLDALKGVLKLALMHDGLARGLREASKALDRRQAHMCVLNGGKNLSFLLKPYTDELYRGMRGGGIQEVGCCALLRA